MSKRVPITPELANTMRRATGDPELDTSAFAVYEARFLTTEPLRKAGILHNARVSASVLADMASFINQEGNGIPLQIVHMDEVLPIGKVISGKVMPMNNGGTELRGQFMIPLDKTSLVSDIDNSIIDEVSVSVLTKQMLCSDCGFDFCGPDSSMMNIMTCTCNNGHTVGKGDSHAKLLGFKKWAELSLVPTGAAQNAKILPRVKQRMSKDIVDQLAASGELGDASIITINTKLSESSTFNGDNKMDEKLLAELKATSTELGEKKIELSVSVKAVETLTAELVSLKASIAEKDKEIADLKDKQGASITDMQAKLAEADKNMAEVVTKLSGHVKAALVASGVDEKEIPATAAAMLSMVEDKGLKLHQVIGAGAKAGEIKASASTEDSISARKNSFKLS